MALPPIIVHSAAHARAALKVAAGMGAGVTLLSAPGAAAYLGATVFRDMIAAAARDYPGVPVTAVLDCGEEPGLALAAIRHGVAAVRIHGPAAVREKLADIAAQRNVVVYEDDGPALDLFGVSDPEAALRAWLSPPAGS